MSQTIAGALVGGALGAYGKKPEIPDLPNINASESMGKAYDANLANLGKAEQLATNVDTFNQNELNRLIDLQLPGGSQQIKNNIMAELHGELPQDVINQILRTTSERSVAGGFQDTQFARALTAQDIGLNSLALTERGLNSAQKWLAQSVAPRMDISSAFYTPQQMLAFDINERNSRYQNQLLKNQVAAAPDPAMVQLAEGFDNFFKTWSSIGTMSLGGGGGMGGKKKPVQTDGWGVPEGGSSAMGDPSTNGGFSDGFQFA